MTTRETVPAQTASASASAAATAEETNRIESEEEVPLVRPRPPAAEVKSAAAAAAAALASSSSSSSSSSSPSPSSSSPLVPVAHSSRGGGIVEAPQGWGQALTAVSSKQQGGRKKRSSGLGLSDLFPQQRVAADFLWHRPLPEAAAAADGRRRWRLARSGQACVLRGAPLAARLVVAPSSSSSSPSPRLLSLEAIAEMGGIESEFGEEDGDDDDEEEGDSDDDDDEEEKGGREAPPRPCPRPSRPRPSRPPPPPPIPATLLTAGPSRRAPPPELYALDERKNLPGAHYRIRFPPTAKLSRRLESAEEGGTERGGGGSGKRRKSALSSLAAAASAWEGRPSLLTARLMTGGETMVESGGREGGEEALRRLVREGIDWRWLSSLAGNDDDGDDGDDDGGGESPSLPPPSPSCWLPPSAVDCEWAGGGGSSSSSAAAGSSSCGGVIVLPASYATHDRVFAQVRGRRRVLVAAPSDALEKCYPLSVAHPCDGASAVLWRDPDLTRWPRFASLRCAWAELGPGDVLRVPAYWMVHSELLLPLAKGERGEAEEAREQEGCVTLVLRSPAARARRCRGSLLLQASRQAELELLRVFPASRAREAMGDLLRIVKSGGGGAETSSSVFSSFPSSSSSSSSSASASSAEADASAAREALSAALGDLRAACLGSARALLRALEAAADPKRLGRTPWLEADGGSRRLFPPALPWTAAAAAAAKANAACGGEENRNRPRLFLDSRTAEEKKYPSLFRATIEAKARERVPWIPKKKKQQLLLLEQQRKKKREEEEKEKGEALLLLEPAE